MAGESGIVSGLKDLTGSLVGIFDNGVQIYQGIQTRIDALKSINNEIPAANSTVVVAPDPRQELSASEKANQALKTNSILLIIAGVLSIILLASVLRRK